MGAVGAWLRFFAGMFTIGATVLYTEPMFNSMDELAITMGLDAHPTLVFVRSARQYALIFVGIALMLSAFVGSTTTESGGYYNR